MWKKKKKRAPGIKDFLWEYMIKRIFPSHFLWCTCWEKQHLAHTNRLAQPKPPCKTHSAADSLKKQRGRKCEHTVARPERDLWNMVPSNQRTQSVVRACGGGGRWESVAWLGSAGVTKGLGMGVTERVMGWGGTMTPAQEQEVEGEGRGSWGSCEEEGRRSICWRGRNWPFGGPAVNSLWAGRGRK